MKAPAQARVALDWKEAKSRISGPVNLNELVPAVEPGFSKSGYLVPFSHAGDSFDLKSCAPKTFNVLRTGTCNLLSQFMKDIEVVRITHGIVCGIENDAASKMAFL